MATVCFPSRMKGAPAGFTRRPHISEEMRSDVVQSGPLSITTTLRPALASTAANVEPDAPAPTMTTSTFSCVAISPPLLGRDMGLVGNAKLRVTVHGAVDHVHGIAAQHEIDERALRALPAFDLVLPHQVDEVVPLGRDEPRETPAILRLARAIHGADCGAIEVHEGRLDIDDARLEQRLGRRHRHLLIDEMRNARLLRAGHQRLAQRLDRLGLARIEEPKRHALRPRLARGHHDFGAAHREGKRARALEKDAPFHGVHGVLRDVAGARGRAARGSELLGVNDNGGVESSRRCRGPYRPYRDDESTSRNPAGVTMGMPRKLPSTNKSSSPVTRQSARPIAAISSNLSS